MYDRNEAVDPGLLAELSLPKEVFTDSVAFIKQVRKGIPGQVLVEAIGAFDGDREMFVRLLETTPGNLHRFYKREALSRSQSEGILDALRVLNYAILVFGDSKVAHEWLRCQVPALSGAKPVDLLDTFCGRDWIRDVLGKIEYGEFS
ncbi:antitoxin Xre/MbcA/ParS toxin-binding domain-containing protein [Halomonas heilongjiangensis]|uniref:antitoxin Xre/MbcA/ParS toxin-binding domain-containing protein n=1 Tax=Halomonas heilongjiangensis TaxID=1387883 RepID=UPI001F0C06C5|nr:antitoxin Xre/MbcA/ParS toxin-binding domain-containing protein [Halomonas heilongjiangensis]